MHGYMYAYILDPDTCGTDARMMHTSMMMHISMIFCLWHLTLMHMCMIRSSMILLILNPQSLTLIHVYMTHECMMHISMILVPDPDASWVPQAFQADKAILWVGYKTKQQLVEVGDGGCCVPSDRRESEAGLDLNQLTSICFWCFVTFLKWTWFARLGWCDLSTLLYPVSLLFGWSTQKSKYK